MGYTLMFYTVPLDQLIDNIQSAEIKATDSNSAQQVFDLLLKVGGKPINGINHSSSGGDWFRDEFLDTAVAALLGSDTADHLLNRPLADLAWEDDRPWFGWLTQKELNVAVAKLDAADLQTVTEPDDDETQEALQELSDTLHKCMGANSDVVTIYS
jgi:hypothetical protein